MADEIDLNFIAGRIEQVIRDARSFRDDMGVLTAIVLRLDHTSTDLLTEIRALHTQIGRMNDRIRKLEGTS